MSVCSDQREDGESTSVSSEAKTDRYGFLLVNGDTNNDSDDPSPELVRYREMKWITLMNQWDQVLEKKHSKIKAQCQKGIPASVRSRCWPLLCGAKQRKDNNKDLYQTLETSPGQQSWIDVITRDTDRQFPFHEMFQSKDSPGQQGLLQVLKAYTQFRPDEGYCQAQGPVAAVLLMNMPMEEAFWCLVQISELYLPGYYSPLLEGVLFDAAVLFSVLKRTCPAAYKHMQRQGVEPLMFATDWLMCLYSRHLPFNTLLRVWDLFFCNGVRVLFQVAVVLVRRCLGEARHRKECDGQMETLERLRSVKGHVQHDQADAFIQEVCSVPLSVAELQRQTEKELQKWRKERPGSTFDPRDRCHGYHMIWEKGKEREKENEKKGKQSATLGVSLMRSQSSLSPAILRKKWRKRGSKAETEEWEGRGLSKQDSDDEEKRRASVCGVAGELRSKTHRTSQDLGTELRKDGNTSTNTQRISGTQPCSESSELSATVFEEDENDVAVTPIPSHTDNVECGEGTRPPSSLKEDDLQTGSSLQDDEEKKVQTHEGDQSEEIPTHQDQPEAETQQEESQPSEKQDEDNARTKLEEETQEDKSNQQEGIENETFKPEEEAQRNLDVQTEEVNITQQEVEVEVNTDTQKNEIHICSCEQEQENEMNSKDGEEIQIDSSKQEEEIGEISQKQQEEIHLGSAEVEAVDNIIKQEKEIQINSSEQEAEIQEEREIKGNSSEEEVEIQEENELKANISEEEVGKKEENEMKESISEEEVEKQEENEMKENIGKEEVEKQEENEMKENIGEEEVEKQEENEMKENISEEEVEKQENEMKVNIIEEEVEKQEENEMKVNISEEEVEKQEENEMKVNISEEEVEKQEENEMKENISEEEVEKQEENEMKESISEEEVEKQEENEMKVNISEVNIKEVEIKEGTEINANSGEQEVEIQNEEKLANSESEEEKLKLCHIDVDEQQEQEMHSDVQTPEDQQDVEKDVPCVQGKDNVKGEICNRINTDMDRTQEEHESERERSEENEQEAGISNSPGEETEGSVLDEEKRNSNHVLGDEEESETVVSSPCSQPEIEMEHGTESEPAQDSNKTQEENMEGNKISTPEHEELDRTSGSSNPEAPQPDNKEEEVEIEKQNTTESNPVATRAPSGSNPNPQLRLRRSSSSHTSYPTILSEDTFKEPQQSIKHEPQTTKAEEHQTTTQPTQTQDSTPEEPETQALPTTQSKSDEPKPKRKGLFHRLRADAPSKSTIPKIVIQDFSEGEEKLSSKERRRRRRMQERKEKEEEKERKKLEKELEKEKERVRKKPQTRGRSFQVLSKKHDDGDDAFSGKSDSQTIERKRNSYSESYF